MTRMVAVWYGTDEDLRILRTAVANHCECDLEHNHVCAAHAMLLDQAALNHLVFAASQRQRYAYGEFDPVAEWF